MGKSKVADIRFGLVWWLKKISITVWFANRIMFLATFYNNAYRI